LEAFKKMNQMKSEFIQESYKERKMSEKEYRANYRFNIDIREFLSPSSQNDSILARAPEPQSKEKITKVRVFVSETAFGHSYVLKTSVSPMKQQDSQEGSYANTKSNDRTMTKKCEPRSLDATVWDHRSELIKNFNDLCNPKIAQPIARLLDREPKEDKPIHKTAEELSVSELVELTLRNKRDSKYVQMILPILPEKMYEDFLAGIFADLERYVENEFACCVLKTLCKTSAVLRERLSQYCRVNLKNCILKPYKLKILKVLLALNEEYCLDILETCRKNFLWLINEQQGGLLVSYMMTTYPHASRYGFILENFRASPELLDSPNFRRLLGGFVEVCDENSLYEVYGMIAKEMDWLAEDRFGNYIVQIFIERGFHPGIESFTNLIKKRLNLILFDKYSRYPLIKLLIKYPDHGLAHTVLFRLSKDLPLLSKVLSKAQTAHMLLLVIANSKEAHHLETFNRALGAWKQSQSAFPGSDVLAAFEHWYSRLYLHICRAPARI